MNWRTTQFSKRCGTQTLLSLMLVLYAGLPSPAQTAFGSLNGRVSDESGAIIAGPIITLTSLETAERQKLTTNSEGDYQFVDLVPGSYQLEIERVGFTRLVRKPIDVTVGVTGPSFCTTANERVYITAIGSEIEFGGTSGLWAAGAGGL